jgi:S1-C subfamily serine protease
LERILDRLTASGGQRAAGGVSAGTAGGRKPLGAKVADASKYALPGGRPMEGAYVGGVKPGSPADVAGVRVGDIITEVGGTPVRSADDLSATLGRLNAGRTSLTLQRGMNKRTVAVDL